MRYTRALFNIPLFRIKEQEPPLPMKFRIPLLTCLSAACGVVTPVHGNVALDPVFGPHMVLQRDIPIPIWGTASPGEEVTVTFGGKSAKASASPDGKWAVKLGPSLANTVPSRLEVTSLASGAKPFFVDDVLVGEVWVGSGQSNMQMPASAFLPNMKTGDQNLNKSPGDRNLQALIDAGPYPLVRLIASTGLITIRPQPPQWLVATPDSLKQFSAHLQAFGIPLSQKLKVPVGLMLAAAGGTPSGRWLSAVAFADDPGCQRQVAKAKETYFPEKEQANYAAAFKRYKDDLAAYDHLTGDQKKIKKPPLPPAPPVAPGELSNRGKSYIGDLHDHMLGQFIGYGIRGVLWDQGESGTAIAGVDQVAIMSALIRSWREEWKQGDFPFLYVQKPSGRGCAFDYSDKTFSWAADPFQPLTATVPDNGKARATYLRIADNTNTFMCPTSDLGSGLHPWNKFGYGARDILVALGAVYGEPVEISGPTYAGSTVDGNKVRVTFKHANRGLVFKNADKLQGFALAGADKKFFWAYAVIDRNTVVVSSSKVAQPVCVRYAFADSHPWANLFNQEGLPALEFSTDP